MKTKTLLLALVAVVIFAPLRAQETRSTLYGHVLDPQAGAIPDSRLAITNVDTNVTMRLQTDKTGYYEVPLLLPGRYQITADVEGFKALVRTGIDLPVSTRLQVDLMLQIGAVSERVTVTAAATLLDTSVASSGRVIDQQSLQNLPVLGNLAFQLPKFAPGAESSGTTNYVSFHSYNAAADSKPAGAVGENEYTMDGAPNEGLNQRPGFMPHVDAVSEFKIETSNFDAAQGHTGGASVAMMTKSGTNTFHGTISNQHYQQRLNGTPFFIKQNYNSQIAAKAASGDIAGANALRSQPMQLPGHSNSYSGTFGGPVILPRIYSGKNKLFFFVSYNGTRETREDTVNLNDTVPTALNRTGNFSDLLAVDAVKYQLYDPLSVRLDPSRPGHYVRDPIPGNIVPSSRTTIPAYKAYLGFMPPPNAPVAAGKEPLNNFQSLGTQYKWKYYAINNRVDYNLSDQDRLFGRWSLNEWNEAKQLWPHLYSDIADNGWTRANKSATVDWVHTFGGTTLLDVNASYNQFREGADKKSLTLLNYKPSDLGFPQYMDDHAGDQHYLPQFSFSGYTGLSDTPTYPTMTQYGTFAAQAALTHVRNKHTIRSGFEIRNRFRTGGGGGNTSGGFNFSNAYTRKADDTNTAGSIGLSWAAFMLGLPDSPNVAYNDTYATSNPVYSGYIHDDWRISPKLTINLGLRFEYELGPTERFNRGLGTFVSNSTLPITSAAQAAYTANPIPELAASSFQVLGGTQYLGVNGASRGWWRNELMWQPRLSAAYQINSKMVLRAGYGIYYDSLNVLKSNLDQSGYSRTTSTTLTTDSGVTWLAGNPRNGVSPMADPFPVRADGTRFDAPLQNALGLMSRAGQGWSYNNFDMKHGRVQRWRLELQRQLTTNSVISVAYVGNYADRLSVGQTLSYLPAQYWATGTVRNDAIASNLTANVKNPFLLSNFAGLQTSSPVVYNSMATSSFFISSTIQKDKLLRAYPQMNGITMSNSPIGKNKGSGIEVSFNRRFSNLFSMNLAYTGLRAREATTRLNEFDPTPAWMQTNNGRPHRFTGIGTFELPFGRTHRFARHGLPNILFGGWQVAATYEFQPGPLIGFGNLYYNGDLGSITSGTRTLDRWFNTDGFEKTAAKQPAQYQARVFPIYIDGLRSDISNFWNGNVQRNFKMRERATLQFRVDALNLANRSQFSGPNTSPASSQFGKVASTTAQLNRFWQFQARVQF